MNKRLLLLIIAVALVLGIVKVAGTSARKHSGSGTKTSSVADSGATSAPGSIVSAISSVSEGTLQTISASMLTSGQKPEVFFEGAEYCPYCATERWPMAIALSKFGTFKNLKLTQSSSSDVYPDTHTLSFYDAAYSSSYVNFTSVELYSNVPDNGFYTPLQTPTAAEQVLANKYDTNQSIPFIDFGGRYVVSGATYSPAVLQGKSWTPNCRLAVQPEQYNRKGC